MTAHGSCALLIEVEARAGERRELVHALLAWTAFTRRLPESPEVRIAEDVEVQGAYLLMSTWPDWPLLESHIGGADFGVLLGAIDVLASRRQFRLWNEGSASVDAHSVIAGIRARAVSARGDDVATGWFGQQR